jgi:hypothetical protein
MNHALYADLDRSMARPYADPRGAAEDRGWKGRDAKACFALGPPPPPKFDRLANAPHPLRKNDIRNLRDSGVLNRALFARHGETLPESLTSGARQ